MAKPRRTAANVCDGLSDVTEALVTAWGDGRVRDVKIHVEQIDDYVQDFRRIIKDQLYHNLVKR